LAFNTKGLLDHARRRPCFALLATLTFLLALGRAGWWWWWEGGVGGRQAHTLTGSWAHGRYHDHVTPLQPEDAEYRTLASTHPWTAGSVMETHCPSFNASLLPPDIFERKLYIAANLKDNEGIMANLIQQLTLLASLYPDPASHLFVSIYESNSQDATGRWLRVLQEELEEMGVPSAVVAGGAKRKVGEEDRIQFLARMRNEAMGPLYRMQQQEQQQQEQQEEQQEEEERRGEEGGEEGSGVARNGTRRRLSAEEKTMTTNLGGKKSSSSSSSSSNSSKTGYGRDLKEGGKESSKSMATTADGGKAADAKKTQGKSSSRSSSTAVKEKEEGREGGKERKKTSAPPVTRRQTRGGQPSQQRRFDHVVFVNDVYFCAYEVLRLLLYNADLACGLDLFLEPSPNKHPETAAVRKELTFYDLWVARDEKGQRFQWGPPFVRHVRGQAREGEGEGEAEYEEAFPVFCCWNGLAVLDAGPFYQGLRFRSVRPGEGVVSECSNVCTDLWVNGHRKVVLDPQIKLAYDEPTYERLHALRPPRYPDLYKVDRGIETVVEAPRTVETCYLDTGRKKEGAMVRFEDCRERPLEEVLSGGTRLEELCYKGGEEVEEEKGGNVFSTSSTSKLISGSSSSSSSSSSSINNNTVIPRILLQLAPFPIIDVPYPTSRTRGWLPSISSWWSLFR